MLLLLLILLLLLLRFVRSWGYRKFVKAVPDGLPAVLDRHRVVAGLVDRIADRVRPVVFRHDIDVIQVTEITTRLFVSPRAARRTKP